MLARLARCCPLLLALAGCRSTAPAAESGSPPPAAPRAQLVQRARVGTVPAGVDALTLRLFAPVEAAAVRLEGCRAVGLVGNAPFEVPIPDTLSGEVDCGAARVSWQALLEDGRVSGRAIQIATQGKPIEVELYFDLQAGDGPTEAAREALEQDLAQRCRVQLAGRAAQPLATRVERVR